MEINTTLQGSNRLIIKCSHRTLTNMITFRFLVSYVNYLISHIYLVVLHSLTLKSIPKINETYKIAQKSSYGGFFRKSKLGTSPNMGKMIL